jgi:hypothetical protein
VNENLGERGPVGEAGVAGVAGRQGEAGVSGPQGETGLAGQRGPAGTSGEAGQTGKSGKTGPQGISFSRAQVAAVAFFILVAVLVLSIRTEIQQRQIARNAARIEHILVENARLQHDICTSRNAAIQRQNVLIDSAIEAEKRRPQPDAKRLQDLAAFKGATPDCGQRP